VSLIVAARHAVWPVGSRSARADPDPETRADLLVRARERASRDGNEGQSIGTPGDGRVVLIEFPGVSRGSGHSLRRAQS
jgi:hypothetical protein